MTAEPYTPEQRRNVEAVVRRAKDILRERKREAVQAGDFDRSFGIVNNEAQIDSFLRERGVTVPDVCPRCFDGRTQPGAVRAGLQL